MIYILIPLLFIMVISAVILAIGINDEEPTIIGGSIIIIILAMATCAWIIGSVAKLIN